MALGYAFKKPLASEIFKSWPNAASKLSGVPFILVLVLLAGILLRHIVFGKVTPHNFYIPTPV